MMITTRIYVNTWQLTSSVFVAVVVINSLKRATSFIRSFIHWFLPSFPACTNERDYWVRGENSERTRIHSKTRARPPLALRRTHSFKHSPQGNLFQYKLKFASVPPNSFPRSQRAIASSRGGRNARVPLSLPVPFVVRCCPGNTEEQQRSIRPGRYRRPAVERTRRRRSRDSN